MRKKLSIVQISLSFLAFIIPFFDVMFKWITSTMFENISKSYKSLFNLMTVQRIGAGPFLFWLFIILIFAMNAYWILTIFVNKNAPENKFITYATFSPLIIMVIMILTAASHSDTFVVYSETRHVSVTTTIFSYIEIIFLLAIPIIECYKTFKLPVDEPVVTKVVDEPTITKVFIDEHTAINKDLENKPKETSAADEIKKYKELLDIDAITQEEYEAKKKELLGL